MKCLLLSLLCPLLFAAPLAAQSTTNHGHSNMSVLRLLSAPSGTLLYNGSAVGGSPSGSITVSGYTMSTAKLLGRTTASTGAIEELSLGTGVATFLATPSLANFNASLSDADVAILGANTFTGAQTITSGTLTASAPAWDITQTWNNAGVTFTGLKLNITSTASAATSLLMDLQVGGGTTFSIKKNGDFTTAGNTIWTSSGRAVQNHDVGFLSDVFGDYYFGDTLMRMRSASGTSTAGAISFYNSTTAHSLYPHNTYTSTTSYERGVFGWASNVLKVGTQKGAGGGTARPVIIVTDDTERLRFGTTGEFILTSKAAPANAADTGTAGEIRVDANYIYICTATNTWKRVAIATW